MKSAYELAMERLNQTAPMPKLTDIQRKELAEIESQYAAKIAAREIALKGAMASASGDWEKEGELRDQLTMERMKLQAELESRKEQVRQARA